MGFALGVGSSFAFWVFTLWVARPHLRLASEVTFDRDGDACLIRAKVRNSSPWSVQDVSVVAHLSIAEGARGARVVSLPVQDRDQPLMGGWARRSQRRLRYGWFGASHRVFRVQLTVDQAVALCPDVFADGGGSLGRESASSLLILSVAAVDGLLFGVKKFVVKTYSASAVLRGTYDSGRSLAVLRK